MAYSIRDLRSCEKCQATGHMGEFIMFQGEMLVCRDEAGCKNREAFMLEMAKRNYEFRTVPGVNPALTVSRDGDVKIEHHGASYRLLGITAEDGTRMSINMAIHKAFPDIPMHEIPEW